MGKTQRMVPHTFLKFGLNKGKQRVLALFLLAGFVASILIPPASLYAQATQTPEPPERPAVNEHVKQYDKEQTDRKPKQNYAGALQEVQTVNTPAADYKDPVLQSGGLQALPNGGKMSPAGNEAQSPVATAKRSGKEEVVSKRTATSETFRNSDGSMSVRQYSFPKYFKEDATWKSIDTSLVEDKNAADSTNIIGQSYGLLKSLVEPTKGYTVRANDWQARFLPSDDAAGMVRIKKGNGQLSFVPQNARAGVKPVVAKDKQGVEKVTYFNLWPGVDVEYIVEPTQLKENLILKNAAATNAMAFAVKGGTLKKSTDTKTGLLYDIDGLDGDFSIAPLVLVLNKYGPEGTNSLKHNYKDGILRVELERSYLERLPADAFPVMIDPTTVTRSTMGNRTSGSYMSFKSDGYVCYSNVCNAYAGSVLDSYGYWQAWRGQFHVPYNFVKGHTLTNARLHLVQRLGLNSSGTTANKNFTVWQATCGGFWGCAGYQGPTFNMGTVADVDITNVYANRIAANDWGAWLMLTGEEVAATTYKNFDPDPTVGTYVEFTYTDILPTPAITSATNGQVFIDPQASFTATNPLTNPASGTPLQYEFCVSTGSGCANTVISSGILAGANWTVPDSLLQDGSTYYIQARTYDPVIQVSGSWGVPVSFRIDQRTGKDSTQAYDTLGPISADLATGNVSTSAASHSSSALGGSLGVSLDYNSPARSRSGLVGEYFNNPDLTGSPLVRRVDSAIDFNWYGGSPANGINADNFSVRWQGNFIAPQTGAYQFGGNIDDGCRIWVDNQLLLSDWYWCDGQYGSTVLNLTAGQVVPIKMEFREAGGAAIARLKVKGTVSASGMTVPSEWLSTGIRPVTQSYGLTGKYYNDPDATKDFNQAKMIMQRTDPIVSFAWGEGPAVPGGRTDDFMVRWTGYITAPSTGTYELGTTSDDGTKVTVGTANTLVVDKWYDDANTPKWGSIALVGGQPTPITVDYYERAGSATMALKMRGNGFGEQLVPTEWLSAQARVLPAGWQLGINADGGLSYDHLKATDSGVTLTDSSGSTHEYVWDKALAGYKPPLNEDGQLTRNLDATFTLQDVDGRTYVFNADGTVQSVTSPVDDAKPAALQYTYGGTPSRLTQITDGVTDTRWAKVFYAGDSECVVPPASFDAVTPAGMLCAVKTDDGRKTSFFYKNGNLARIAEPGNELTDYQYDSLGRIVAVRDVLANDAIAAGVRTDDATANTELEYDELGRVKKVTQPAATTGASRTQHTLKYLPGQPARWTETQSIGIEVASSPVSVSWGGDRIDLFARGAINNDLVHKYFQAGTWSEWESLGGCIQGDPSATSAEPGRIDVAVRGCTTTNNILVKTYNKQEWGAYVTVPGTTTASPAISNWGSGRLDLFIRDANNNLAQNTFWNNNWLTWSYPGGSGAQPFCISESPEVSAWDNNRLDIFVRSCTSSSANLFTINWNGSAWSGYQQIGTDIIFGDMAVDTSKPQSIDLFTKNAAGDIQQRTYSETTAWTAPQTIVGACTTAAPSFSYRNTHEGYLFYRGCEASGANTYMKPYIRPLGATQQHVVGATEPHGFSRKIEYDTLLRTLRDTDIANMSDSTEWHPVKDLVFGSTDEAGLRSTTIYDDDDRPMTHYGPAPAGWYGADRKPLAAYANQVPRTDTFYDEGMQGPSVTYYTYGTASKSLMGAPKLHTTNLSGATAGDFSKDYGTGSPISGVTTNWGFRATGKLRLPQTGTYRFRIVSDGGVKVYFDDKIEVDDWNDGASRSHPEGGLDNIAGSVHRLRIDYFHTTGNANFTLYMTPPGGTETAVGINQYISPAYNLTTSTKAYDATLGTATSTTNFGSSPELGLPQSTSTDPTGLNLTTTSAYETAGAAGSFLRQTSKTLPGSPSTNPSFAYAHYAATDTKDNPCTTGTTEAYKQAGFMKLKTEADPDGTGTQASRTTETIYDDAGRVVATRYNTDSWTCTTYDARGRVTTTVIPSVVTAKPDGGTKTLAGRTVTNNYAWGGNPLVTASTDPMGTILTTVDLLGRTTSYTDVYGDTTTSTYDNFGKLTQRVGQLGTEAYEYDTYNRPTNQKLDGITYATTYYDAYSRIDHVDYPNAGAQKLTIGRNALGQTDTHTYNLVNASSQAIVVSDAVTRSQSGQTLTNTATNAGAASTWTYGYDAADRLTSASLAGSAGTHSYTYGFGAQDASCGTGTNTNPNSGKNSNRTTQTINGVATTYCYDYADRLTSSSNALHNTPKYDAHGNMTKIGTGTTPLRFYYDSSDRNSGIDQYTTAGNGVAEYYDRDVQGRIVARYKNNIVAGNWQSANEQYYYFTGSGDAPDYVRNGNGTIIQKYLSLPGGVLLTIRPPQSGNAQKTYSLPNLHGDTLATTNASGALIDFTLYGPFGEQLPGQPTPNNTLPGATYGYVGQHQKLTETAFVLPVTQMGARLYLPTLGRFAQVDPIEGGTENNYVYPADPVNEFDLTGEFSIGGMAKDYFSPTSSRFIWGAAAGALNVARGKSFKKGYDSGTLAHDIVGTVATAGGGGASRIASLAWSKGKLGSRMANMMYHFNKHGKAVGAKSPISYTLRAIGNAAKGSRMGKIASKSTVYVNGKKVVQTYKGRLASYMISKNPIKWFNNHQ